LNEISVVIPAYNASDYLPPCLDALVADGFSPAEIVIVDDGSTDDTPEIARDRGVTLIRNGAQSGAGAARNTGVAATSADIILFVDADVVVAKGTRDKILQALPPGGKNAAVFGSYDDAPASRRLVSHYRNLLHFHTHQTSPGRAHTFWTGLGAVRRSDFDAIGGFEPVFRYPEDIDLGARLDAAGRRVELIPDIQGKHLKDWTTRSMFMTDWKRRAAPWARMLREGTVKPGALNTSRQNQASAALVLVALLALVASLFEARFLFLFGLTVVSFVLTNLGLFRLLWRKGGARLAVASLYFHAVHYVAAILGLAQVQLFERPRKPLTPAETSNSRQP
jgi:glycosyltransferase involved in cell wall biosynthesis